MPEGCAHRYFGRFQLLETSARSVTSEVTWPIFFLEIAIFNSGFWGNRGCWSRKSWSQIQIRYRKSDVISKGWLRHLNTVADTDLKINIYDQFLTAVSMVDFIFLFVRSFFCDVTLHFVLFCFCEILILLIFSK